MIRRISALFLGLPKNRGKQGFSWSWFSVFFLSKKGCIFSICNMWCPYARLSLRVPSSLQMSDSSWLSYLFLLFSFCFLFVFCFFFGGGVYLFTLITSMVLYQWPKTQDQTTEKPQYLKFYFWCSALGPAPSHFHLAHTMSVTLNSPPPKIVLVYFIMLLIMCWNSYFTVFFEHQPNLPSKSALKKR